MSHKPCSTKATKVTRSLEARRAHYDKYLKDWSDCHRPGGNPSQHSVPVVFKDQSDAIERIHRLGFGHLVDGSFVILKGEGSLAFWKCADYLVKHWGFKFSKVGA